MKKRVTVSLDEYQYEKLKEIAKQVKRFTSKQAEYWVRHGIRTYEKVYGVQDSEDVVAKYD